MSRRTNLINNAISTLLTALGFALVVIFANRGSASLGTVLAYFLLSAVVAGFICTAFHEMGHLIAGKINGFAFGSITVWFFKWSREKNKIVFNL